MPNKVDFNRMVLIWSYQFLNNPLFLHVEATLQDPRSLTNDLYPYPPYDVCSKIGPLNAWKGVIGVLDIF